MRLSPGVAGCLLLSGMLIPAWASTPGEQSLELFEKRIRPVLVQHCHQCHSAKSKKVRGGLRLDTSAGIRKGGDSGAVVVPGKPKDSLLIEALRYESLEMPPKGKLPDAVIADFVKWVQMGAPGPRQADSHVSRGSSSQTEIDIEKGRHFWCFQPIQKPSPPEVRLDEWPRTDIDRFILARLEAEGLSPGLDADKQTLIRRCYFDLIGLPPTPAQAQRFVDDTAPNAFEKVIDDLVDNVHFGERWGRHWLDVVRFAESSGGGRTRIFYDAWRYRDYVIDSLNRDTRFDQFVIEQIAGDLLPCDNDRQRENNVIATGFLALGPTNYELQDKEVLRMEVIDEQMDTIGRAFLALTIGCARCHDHKFDPIPIADYYAMAGIFRSTKTLVHANVSNPVETELPISAEHRRALQRHQEQIDPVRQRINKAKTRLKQAKDRLVGKSTTYDPRALPGIVLDDTQATLRGKWSTSRANLYFVGPGYRYASPGKSHAVYRFPIRNSGMYEVRTSYNAHSNRSGKVFVTIKHAVGTTAKQVSHKKSPPIDELFISLGRYPFEKDQVAEVSVSCDGADGVVVIDAVQLLPDRSSAAATIANTRRPDVQTQDELKTQVVAAETALELLEVDLRELEKQAPPLPPKTMSVREEDKDEIGDFHVCIRGDVHNLGEKTSRGFLSVVSSGKPIKIAPRESGRLELARWIASSENPLTARVIVNRIWHHLFGTGLVRTVDNFGRMGERPSHPRLLDYLASRMIEERWSFKKTIKDVMLSRVYQLSNKDVSRRSSIDPENRFYRKANRRRLEAEAIRDAILFVSGQLELTVGGLTIDRKAKSEFEYRFETRRRSVYVPVFRNTLHDLFAVFDFADPNFVVGRRSTSTIPTQALYLMNSPFVLEQSRHAAAQLLKTSATGDRGWIERAFRQTLGRPPTSGEHALALDYFGRYNETDEQEQQRQIEIWGRFYQVLFSCIDFRYVE